MALNERRSRYYTYVAPVIKHPIIRSYGSYIFSLVAVSIFLIFAIRPTISTISVLQKNISNQKEILEGLNTKSRSLKQAQANLESIDSAKLAKLSGLLPSQPNISSLVNSLKASMEPTASISALQIEPVTVIDDSTENKSNLSVNTVDFSFTITGSYTGLMSSLDKIMKANRLINLKIVNLSRQSQEPVSMSITGKAYFLQ